MDSDIRQRILDAVDVLFDAQLATTCDLVAIPSTRGAEGPCQDMIGDLLRERSFEVDDWYINLDDLKDLRGYGPIEHDFSKARSVVGTYRPSTSRGSGFLSEGYELKDSADAEAAFGKAYGAVYGGEVVDLAFTALTDTRFYGLNYSIPSLCFGASGAAMHSFNEHVDLDSLRQSTKATALFVAEWCGVEKR